MRLSKYCPLILILLIGLVVGCSHEKPIDEVFRWPSSGVPEADSLILEFERRTLEIDTPVRGYKDIEVRMCSVAANHPDNKLVQSRSNFIQYNLLAKTKVSDDSLHSLIADEKIKLDSAIHPFDWHKWMALEIDIESDMMKKYLKAMDNIVYFKKNKALYEEGQAHLQLGIIMKFNCDTVQAKIHYLEAEKIFKNLSQQKNVLICQFNLANILPKIESDSIYLQLINDPSARNIAQLQIAVMQNYFISTGKVEYLDSALRIANNYAYFQDKRYFKDVPFILALKGNYYDQIKNNPTLGKRYILNGFDSIKSKTYPARYLYRMYLMLASAYGNTGQLDSAAYLFYHSIMWRDSLDNELQQTRVMSVDTKTRIKLIEQSLRHQHNIWVWSLISIIIVIILGIIILIINHRRKQAIKEYQQLLVEQKLQKSMQSVQIQTMVIEENEKFIDELSEQIKTLRQTGEIDIASAGVLTRIMKLHKNDREAHKGLLEVQKGLNNEFMNKLKEDYPGLTEGQLKLASLIAIGTESPQICRILGIQLSSLHKSRYRLRTRLGLNNDDSLEEFLRNRNKSAI